MLARQHCPTNKPLQSSESLWLVTREKCTETQLAVAELFFYGLQAVSDLHQ